MINYTNPDRERFVNIAAMALFNVPANDDALLNKILDNNANDIYVKAIKCIKCTADSINVRMKDRFDNYHLTKIDCDFPALVESLNF